MKVIWTPPYLPRHAQLTSFYFRKIVRYLYALIAKFVTVIVAAVDDKAGPKTDFFGKCAS